MGIVNPNTNKLVLSSSESENVGIVDLDGPPSDEDIIAVIYSETEQVFISRRLDRITNVIHTFVDRAVINLAQRWITDFQQTQGLAISNALSRKQYLEAEEIINTNCMSDRSLCVNMVKMANYLERYNDQVANVENFEQDTLPVVSRILYMMRTLGGLRSILQVLRTSKNKDKVEKIVMNYAKQFFKAVTMDDNMDPKFVLLLDLIDRLKGIMLQKKLFNIGTKIEDNVMPFLLKGIIIVFEETAEMVKLLLKHPKRSFLSYVLDFVHTMIVYMETIIKYVSTSDDAEEMLGEISGEDGKIREIESLLSSAIKNELPLSGSEWEDCATKIRVILGNL